MPGFTGGRYKKKPLTGVRGFYLVDGTGLEPVTPCTSTNRVKRAEKDFRR